VQFIVRRVAPLLGTCALLLAFAGSALAADRYVALGDSYSSGTGTRSYTLDANCQRGVRAYPYLLSQQRPNTALTFVACSGAKTTDVMNNQISSVTSDTRIVTITIGGNDAGFSSVITQCALPWPFSCDSNITTAQNYIRNTLPGQLNTVYNAIKTRAPSATVVVLGYPRLFAGVDCNAGTFFSTDEMNKLNATADLLRDTERGRAQAYGFTFKDAIPPFIGHAVCSSSEWLNGLSNPVSDSYHPNATGHSSGYLPLVRSVVG
jgi:lysophospholipase L1-like esterase